MNNHYKNGKHVVLLKAHIARTEIVFSAVIIFTPNVYEGWENHIYNNGQRGW